MKFVFLVLTWFISIFTILIQMSENFALWFNPHLVSYNDERYFYTLGPAAFNIIVLYLIIRFNRGKLLKKSLYTYSFVLNIILFIFYIIFQISK